jgi:C4-dicarboxylate transporter, DctM subunit
MIITLGVSFIILIFLGVPMAFCAAFSSLLAFILNSPLPSVIVIQKIYNQLDSFSLMAVPLFVLTGQLMNTGGITRRIINFSKIFFRKIPGSLSHVNVLTSMLFAGISGSATADAAGVGAILIPAMVEDGYEEDWAVGITAASSTIGPIIPPSVLMIVYGSITQLSIGRLFLAGLIPGILVGISLLVVGYILAKKRRKARLDYQITKREAWLAFKDCWPTLLTPVIIIAGITGGVFTPTEAGVVAALYALILGFFYGELNIRRLSDALWVTAKSTIVVLFIIGCSAPFGWILAHENVPVFIVDFLTTLSSHPAMMMLFTIIIMFITGLFIDGLAAMLIFVPVLFPVANEFGIDPYHFAIVIIIAIEIGGVTPPVGILLYIACGVNNIPIRNVSPLIWVFVSALMVVLLLVAYIPPLATLVPDLLMG